MIRRVFTLVGYLVHRSFFSLAGAAYALLGLVFWSLFFDPRLRPPGIGYYVLMNGTFGVLISFLVTLTVAGYANRAMHYPVLVRLHTRAEYLTAVAIAALGSAAVYQIAVAILATVQHDRLDFSFVEAIQYAFVVWIPFNTLSVAVALHISNLVKLGRSRALVSNGLLMLLLLDDVAITWLAETLYQLGDRLCQKNLVGIGNTFVSSSDWLIDNIDSIGWCSDTVFWPVRATIDIVKEGEWQPTLRLSVGILLVYSVILFVLAIRLFTRKDLHLTE